MKLTVNKVYEVEDDFQTIFIARSNIHVRPKHKQLKLSSRTINEVHYEDLYILEPKKFYCIEFNEQRESYLSMAVHEILNECGLIYDYSVKNRVFVYNATMNIVYIQQGAELGEAYSYG